MLEGDKRQRNRALFALAMWFAMGAFVGSVLDHYIDIAMTSEHVAALVGGGVASAVALVIKSV